MARLAQTAQREIRTGGGLSVQFLRPFAAGRRRGDQHIPDEGGEWITIVDPALPFTGTAQGSLPITLYGDTEVRVLNSSGASANIWLR